MNNEDINGRSFPYLCIWPSAPKAKRPIYSPLVPSSLSPNRLVSKTGPACPALFSFDPFLQLLLPFQTRRHTWELFTTQDFATSSSAFLGEKLHHDTW